MSRFSRTLVIGSAVAALATGVVGGAAQAAPAAPASAPAATASTLSLTQQAQYRFHYISQLQGQPSQYVDCGPTSTLMALLQKGGTLPDSYNDQDQSSAIQELRWEAGRGDQEFLYTTDIMQLLANHGVQGTQYGPYSWEHPDADEVVQAIKGGKSAIVLTQTGVIANEISDPGYGHFVYVSGYNARTRTFTINDPVHSSRKSFQATEQQLRNIIDNPASGNEMWAYAV